MYNRDSAISRASFLQLVDGRLAHQEGMGDVIKLTASGIAGLVVLQGCGLLNLVLGGLVVAGTHHCSN